MTTRSPATSAPPVVAERAHTVRRTRPFRVDGTISARGRAVLGFGMFVIVGLIWSAFTQSGIVKPIFLPGPVAVAQRLVEQVQSGQLWSDIGVSVVRIMSAFVIAAIVALPLGLLMGRIRAFESLLVPITEFVRYMPVVAFTPLTVVWFGVDESQKLVLIFLGTFFALLLMVMDDVQRVPREYVESSRTFGMSGARILRAVVLRGAMPSIWDSFRLALGWCWSWLVLGELVAASSGLGYRISLAQRYLDTSLIIGYILVLGLLGLITDQVMRLLKRLMFSYLDK